MGTVASCRLPVARAGANVAASCRCALIRKRSGASSPSTRRIVRGFHCPLSTVHRPLLLKRLPLARTGPGATSPCTRCIVRGFNRQPATGNWQLLVKYPEGVTLVSARRGRILAASFAIYAFWGSAYLAMRVGLRTLPPLVLAGTRLVLAGLLMTGWAWLRGARCRWRELRTVAAAAALLFLGGHGFLYWGQARVSSGMAAVLFATVPLWIVLLEGLSSSGIRLGWRALTGLVLGMLGVVMLVGPQSLLGAGRVDLAGAAAIGVASLSWAVGSIYCTRARLPHSAALSGGLEMLTGG